MILKVVHSEADKAYEFHEISNIYTENDYMEGALQKNGEALDREIIVNEGQIWINVLPGAEFGDDTWEVVQVLTDAGSVLWEAKNLDIELVKTELAKTEVV